MKFLNEMKKNKNLVVGKLLASKFSLHRLQLKSGDIARVRAM